MMRRRVYLLLLLVVAVVVGGYLTFASSSSDSSPTVIAAIEKQRGSGYVSYMIHEYAVSNGEVAFFLRNMPNGWINIGAEYVNKTSKGWRWGIGGSFGASNIRLGLNDTEARKETFHAVYFPSSEGSGFGSSPFPMYYGVVINPDITRISVKDNMTGLEKQAEIITVERNLRLFYVFVDKAQGTKFDIIGYAVDGSIKHKETTDESLLSVTKAGEVR